MQTAHHSGMIKIVIASLALVTGMTVVNCKKNNPDNSMLKLMFLGLSTSPKIHIFNAGNYNGNLGGRAGADNLCITAQAGYTALAGKTVKAFISVSGTDQIKDLVPMANQSLPVYGIKADNSETRLKDSWTNLWGNVIEASLQTAAGITGNWWSGSTSAGLVSGDPCSQWADSSSGPSAATGEYHGTDASWANISNYSCNNATPFVLCVAY